MSRGERFGSMIRGLLATPMQHRRHSRNIAWAMARTKPLTSSYEILLIFVLVLSEHFCK